MATQTYETHRHNPLLTGLGSLMVVIAIIAFALRWFDIGGRAAMATGLGALVLANMVLITISRAYTVRLQDRIIKLEMRVRCASLLSPAQQALLARLSKPQVIALLFASDAELPALLERADREHLSADEIKRAVKVWVPDLDRT
jgi:hypothetical protein